MTATFAPMAKPSVGQPDDNSMSKVQLGARVDPRFLDLLDALGRRLRELGVDRGVGGKSNAVEAILEMAEHMKWFENHEQFAAELLRSRADALASRAKKRD